jgi:hypothetical protein
VISQARIAIRLTPEGLWSDSEPRMQGVLRELFYIDAAVSFHHDSALYSSSDVILALRNGTLLENSHLLLYGPRFACCGSLGKSVDFSAS